MQLENLEIPISESDLELLRLIKKKSAFLQLKNLDSQDFDESSSSKFKPKVQFESAFQKIILGMGQSLISQDQNHNSPLSFPPKSFSRKKSIIEPISTAENHLPEDLEGLPNILITEKKKAAKNIISLLKLRKKYRFQGHRDYEHCENLIEKLPGSTEPIINYNKTIEMLPTLSKSSLILNEDGVYEVMVDGKMVGKKILTALEFLDDLAEMVKHIHKSLNKSLSNNRLALLDERYQMYKLRYSEKEQFEAQAIVHRDFYNCRKVDTHIHFAACMRAKQLLRFMVEKIEKDGDRNVIFDKGENKWKSLREICQRINVDSKDINLDSLNVQADSSIFERFDRFNDKYNPLGVADLRNIFLKTDNDMNGAYLAELTKLITKEMEDEKYCFAEWRVSIYGKSCLEWKKLANWFKEHEIFSHQVRWMIQIPRLYNVYRRNCIIKSFQEMIDNIFKPIFEVTLDPSKDPALYQLLFQIVGFDTVDDESIYEVLNLEHLAKTPSQWTKEENPIYAYWIYYIYANLFSLNSLRVLRGLNTFSFRPHCGESGNVDHLAVGFLVADGINHGIRLEFCPVLQYLYYLEQIGIAMSPLSNNKLFLQYQKNPFPKFFAKGLNVSLSTDDPLIIHLTKEPLLEEYAVAAQVWNFSTVDLCEIARNSVLMSGFEGVLKRHWIGEKGNNGKRNANEPNLTNVPNSRFWYRFDTLLEEKQFLNSLSGESLDNKDIN